MDINLITKKEFIVKDIDRWFDEMKFNDLVAVIN